MTTAACCALVLASCSKNRLVISETPANPTPQTESLTEVPKQRDPSISVDFLDKSIRRPLTYVFIPPRAFRSWFGNKVEAYNPTAEDDVTNSSWFAHRNDRRRMTPDEVARGPYRGTGPDTSGSWTVIRAKSQGITPGFTIRDTAGVIYLIKFDPPGFEEMMTAAEVITSRLMYAAGYNVPEGFVTVFDPAKLRAGASLTFEDPLGRKQQADDITLQVMLDPIPRRPDGRVRAMASRILPGGLGPFNYEGTRSDDPADTIPHEHRRELRGLYVMAAWLNHLDVKQQNSLDILVEDGDRSFVKHYLIDFGSSLGSAAIHPNTPRDGAEYDLDLGAISARWFTAGFYTSSWERYSWKLKYPSIGFYSAELFDPGDWKSSYPNPAFQNRTTRDGYWGAKLVASFDEQQIRAAVATGQLSDPRAAQALAKAIMGRRDLTVTYWFLRVTPLEELGIESSPEGPTLVFRDLAVAEGVVPARGRRYDMLFEFPAARLKLRDVTELQISTSGYGELMLPAPAGGPELWERLLSLPVEKRLAKLELRAIPRDGEPQPRSVRIYLLLTQEGGYRIVGRAY
ncbi:MAG: hypothetical protein V3U13_07910 [Gemmatimonadota bacterium]